MDYVLDSSFIIAIYAEIKVPEILEKLCSMGFKFHVPQTVYEETIRKIKDKHSPHVEIITRINKHVQDGIINVVNVNPLEEYEPYLLTLDDGEVEVISLSIEEGFMPVIDEATANKTLDSLGIEGIRTGRFISNCVREWSILSKEEGISCLIDLKNSDFRIKDGIIEQLIKELETTDSFD